MLYSIFDTDFHGGMSFWNFCWNNRRMTDKIEYRPGSIYERSVVPHPVTSLSLPLVSWDKCSGERGFDKDSTKFVPDVLDKYIIYHRQKYQPIPWSNHRNCIRSRVSESKMDGLQISNKSKSRNGDYANILKVNCVKLTVHIFIHQVV